MPTPTKFTESRRTTILEALRIGASRNTAAQIAGVSGAQITRWLAKGEKADEESAFHQFREAVLTAEAEPKLRALGVVYRAMPDRPDLAWKFVERREPGYAPPERDPQPQITGPVVIALTLPGRPSLPTSTVEVLESDVAAEST